MTTGVDPGLQDRPHRALFFFILELIVKIWLKFQMFSFSGSVEGLVRQVVLSREPRWLASAWGLTTVVLGARKILADSRSVFRRKDELLSQEAAEMED